MVTGLGRRMGMCGETDRMGGPPAAVLLLELRAHGHLQGGATRPLDGPERNKRGRIPDVGEINLGGIWRILGIKGEEVVDEMSKGLPILSIGKLTSPRTFNLGVNVRKRNAVENKQQLPQTATNFSYWAF